MSSFKNSYPLFNTSRKLSPLISLFNAISLHVSISSEVNISFNRSEWAKGLAQIMVNLIENKPVDSSKFIPNYTIIRRNSF